MLILLETTPKIITSYHSLLAGRWRKLIQTICEDMASQPQLATQAEIFQDYALNTGKMIRPSLLLFSFESFCSSPAPQAPVVIVKLALSLELLHLCLLIQDDVMDECSSRRSRPSLHKAFEDYHIRAGLGGDSKLYGSNLAVLVSGICANYAEKAWTTTINNRRIDPSLRTLFDRLKNSVYEGQCLDLHLSAQPRPPQLEEILDVMKYKTALYTMYYPMLLGARLAGASPMRLRWLRPFAINLGVAFQTVDDILGTFGDPGETGKPTHQDILQKKQTPLLFFAYHYGSEEDKLLLDTYFSQPVVEEALVAQVKEVFIKSAAAQHARMLAEEHTQRAIRSLEKSFLKPADHRKLEELVKFVLSRGF